MSKFPKIARPIIFLSIIALIVYGATKKDELTSSDSIRSFTLNYVEDFPVMATDVSGQIWLAVIERPNLTRQIGVYRLVNSNREQVCTLTIDRLTGIGRPAITGLEEGCMVAFSAQIDGAYQVAYARIDDGKNAPACKFIASGGTANIKPSLAAVGKRFACVWESNVHGYRSIEMAWIDVGGTHSKPRTISKASTNNSNPEIISTENGAVFAAWDSMREDEIDIYGAWYRDGQWHQDQRLTSDPRIERHVSLAANKDKIWMAWQAQSFKGPFVNGILEQRVVVAQLDGNKLLSPIDSLEYGQINFRNRTIDGLLMRPQIAFDSMGRLWLTARKAIDQRGGWKALAWCYSGRNWSDARMLVDDRGRWRPVPIVFGEFGGVAAVQYDNQPTNHGIDIGMNPDWKSEIKLVAFEKNWGTEPEPLETAPLKIPKTCFRLADRINASNARQTRQQIKHAGRELTLFWGDLHEHTDMSVCARSFNPPADDLYANQRDIEMLDFTAITDHGYNIDKPLWAYTTEQIGHYHDPDRFLALLGQEWSNRYGHHNIIFENPQFHRFFDALDGNISPPDVWRELENVEFVMIPHQLADRSGQGPPKNWNYAHEHHMPLAEIYQNRGSYEYFGAPGQAAGGATFEGSYLQNAWERELVIGVIASPDHGGGRGKAGVWATELTRESLFKAFHARHTFGTSGAKIALFFSSGDNMMGDTVQQDGDNPIDFHFTALAGSPVKELVIFRNNESVYTTVPGTEEVKINWRDKEPPAEKHLWYYVRIQCQDDELAWTSPIWFFNKNAKTASESSSQS